MKKTINITITDTTGGERTQSYSTELENAVIALELLPSFEQWTASNHTWSAEQENGVYDIKLSNVPPAYADQVVEQLDRLLAR